MMRIDALGVVASVQDALALRNWTLVNRERYPVSTAHTSSNAKGAVSHAPLEARSLPLPTLIEPSNRHLAEKSIDVFWGELHMKTITQGLADFD